MEEAIAVNEFLNERRKAKANTHDAGLGDLGKRMLKRLREPYLKPEYRPLLKYLSEQEDFVHNYKVAEALGIEPKQPGARLAKLSARMKLALTDEEALKYPSPIHCLVEVSYDEHGSSSYRMTEIGRQVVTILLAD